MTSLLRITVEASRPRLAEPDPPSAGGRLAYTFIPTVILLNVLSRYSMGVILLAVVASSIPTSSQSQPGGAAPVLSVKVSVSGASPSALLPGDDAAWKAIPSVPIHLDRTPPLYDTDPKDDGYRPSASMQLIRQDTSLYVRLTWSDDTVDSIPAAKTYADVGEPEVYKRQSEVVDRFRDAACVMIPRERSDGTNPSMVMGDVGHPVILYYWRNGEGFAIGAAAGRGSTSMSATSFPGHASHRAGQWRVVFSLPMKVASLPLALAIWDGSKDHRDGLKYYSLWYEVHQ